MKLMITVLVSMAALSFAALLSEPEYESLFARWMEEYDKKYDSEAEQARRFRNFKANYDMVTLHNENKASTFTMEMNRFADISDDDLPRLSTYRPPLLPPSSKNKAPAPVKEDTHTVLQTSNTYVDWRTTGHLNPVRDSPTGCDADWGYSAAAAMESAQSIATGGAQLHNMSISQLMDCGTYGAECNQGAPEDAYRYVIDNGGVGTETEYPSINRLQSCKAANATKKIKITSYASVPAGDEVALRAAIDQGPVVVTISTSAAVYMYRYGIVDTYCGSWWAPLTFVAIGYDTVNQYYILRNSWGDQWGEAGHIRIRMGIGMCDIADRASYPIY